MIQDSVTTNSEGDIQAEKPNIMQSSATPGGLSHQNQDLNDISTLTETANPGILIGNMPGPQTYDPNLALMDSLFPHDGSLGDFLADVMMPVSPANMAPSIASGYGPAEVRDVLDYGIDNNFDLNDFDFGMLNSYDLAAWAPQVPQIQAAPLAQNPITEDSSYPPSRSEETQHLDVNKLSIEAFQRSVWRWTPGQSDRAHCEQNNLSVPSDVGVKVFQGPCEERIAQQARDKIMGMLFATCEQSVIAGIISHFPSAELLDSLMQQYLHVHMNFPDSWIHIPTFSPSTTKPELLTMLIACGAVNQSVPAIRKLGFALDEAVRLALPKSYEADNRRTRDLDISQAYALQLDVGSWSGNKRKMELAESHPLQLITMMRRSGRFRKVRPTSAAPTFADSGDVLEEKWRAWVESESFKRLAFHVMIHDSQTSMSFLIPPLITYNEISLDLPSAPALWQAKTASAWREAYLAQDLGGRKVPNLTGCIQDAHQLLDCGDRVDMVYTTTIVLHRLWSLVWDCRQLSSAQKHQAVHSPKPTIGNSLISSYWQQELAQVLHSFWMVASELETTSSAATLVQEHLLLNIYVSFEELQLFAGKEGGQDARRVFPSLRQWAESRDSRQAVWHAGQILRAAAMMKSDTLRDFYAIAVYHAGLTFWAYGILANESRRPALHRSASFVSNGARPRLSSVTQEMVYLDDQETAESQRFIALGRATPALQRRNTTAGQVMGQSVGTFSNAGEAIFLNDPKSVMEVVTDVLQQEYAGGNARVVPPLVENLTHLMQDLSNAATKVSRKY